MKAMRYSPHALLILGMAMPSLLVAQEREATLPTLEATRALSGYFYAKSSSPDESAPGGFSVSERSPRLLTPAIRRDTSTIEIRVNRQRSVPFRREFVGMGALPDAGSPTYQGFEVLIINATDEPLVLRGQDSRLSVVREALDADGVWRPIEDLPGSWCGNSYHEITLAAGHYWSFAAPVYEGPFSTRMRFRLGDHYSNEFEGKIHLLQFQDLSRRSLRSTDRDHR